MDNESNETLDALRGIDRSLRLLVRLAISQLRGERDQKEMILLLDSLGFKSGEIIDHLGAAESTVRPTLSRAHKKK
jgi:DNA-directed RNA polymerase specialized sigma24 family protein